MSSIDSLIIIYLQPPGYLISVVLTISKINHRDRIRLNHLKNIASLRDNYHTNGISILMSESHKGS